MQYACSAHRTFFFDPLFIAQVFEFVQIDTINYAGSHGTDIKMASTTWGEIVSISTLHNYSMYFQGLRV
jgi:hypothetical protein